MRYLGGKHRQGPIIARSAERLLSGPPSSWFEPFSGALGSGSAAMVAFPNCKFVFNDLHQHLQYMWKCAQDGWNPPEHPTEADWRFYRDNKPVDPMTAYLGFAWSFGGRFFEGPARTGGVFTGSYKSLMKRIDLVRSRDVTFTCDDFASTDPLGYSVVYMDPPYAGRKAQDTKTPRDVEDRVFKVARDWAAKNDVVLITEFKNPGFEVVHNFGDTVVRHHSSKGADGTTELLMRVNP